MKSDGIFQTIHYIGSSSFWWNEKDLQVTWPAPYLYPTIQTTHSLSPFLLHFSTLSFPRLPLSYATPRVHCAPQSPRTLAHPLPFLIPIQAPLFARPQPNKTKKIAAVSLPCFASPTSDSIITISHHLLFPLVSANVRRLNGVFDLPQRCCFIGMSKSRNRCEQNLMRVFMKVLQRRRFDGRGSW